MDVNKEKICYTLPFCFYKGEKASQASEIVNAVHGHDIATSNDAQFLFRRFRSGFFVIQDAPHKCKPFVENLVKIMEMIEVDRHGTSRSIA